MKWSELPKEYKDLENGFGEYADVWEGEEDIKKRFRWHQTLQGNVFWGKCYFAKTISELPQIPKNESNKDWGLYYKPGR